MSFRGPNPGFNVFDDMVVGVAIEPGYKRSQFGAPTPVIAALTLVEEIVIEDRKNKRHFPEIQLLPAALPYPALTTEPPQTRPELRPSRLKYSWF